MQTQNFPEELRARVAELLVGRKFDFEPPTGIVRKHIVSSGFPQMKLDIGITFEIKEFEIGTSSAKLTAIVNYGPDSNLEPAEKISELTEFFDVERTARRLVSPIWTAAQYDKTMARVSG